MQDEWHLHTLIYTVPVLAHQAMHPSGHAPHQAGLNQMHYVLDPMVIYESLAARK